MASEKRLVSKQLCQAFGIPDGSVLTMSEVDALVSQHLKRIVPVRVTIIIHPTVHAVTVQGIQGKDRWQHTYEGDSSGRNAAAAAAALFKAIHILKIGGNDADEITGWFKPSPRAIRDADVVMFSAAKLSDLAVVAQTKRAWGYPAEMLANGLYQLDREDR